MNKNKIIFIIVTLVIVTFLVFMMSALGNDKPTTSNKKPVGSGGVTIWTFGDDRAGIQNLLQSFTTTYPAYEKVVFNIENFTDYETYTLALSSAISKNKGPDIFVINNNDSSIFAEQVVAIPNTVVNASDFRKKYKAVFGEDLIISFDDSSEFVTGVPIGYETLGVYYNRKFVTSTDLSSQASLSSLVSQITDKDDEKIGIALGNGSTIISAQDIITQYFMLSGADSLTNLDDKTIKTAMETFFRYGSDGSDNGYNSDIFLDLISTGRNNLDLFSQGDIAMVVGYPRMLDQISQKGYSKKFLLASPFPHYAGESGKTLLNYNSFVVNKDSLQTDAAYNLLAYMTTEQGTQQYLNSYSYYLPALLSLESERMNQKIDEGYNIALGDFYDNGYELSSFDKGIKSKYDREMIAILDNAPSYNVLTTRLVSKLICQSKKLITLEGLSTSCE